MVEQKSLPAHVAVIMDGNGRWAQKRGLSRVEGHKAGRDALKRVIEAGYDRGLRVMTFFCFSTENWSRPESEVSALKKLFREMLHSDFSAYAQKGVRVRFAGDLSAFDADIREQCEKLAKNAPAETKMDVVFALNYGGRDEIVRAARAVAQKAADGDLPPDAVTAETLARELYNPDLPFPDLLIRTSGEKRVSNFLLWQCAYAEFYFTDVLWPDFNEAALDAALTEFASRTRRFGGI